MNDRNGYRGINTTRYVRSTTTALIARLLPQITISGMTNEKWRDRFATVRERSQCVGKIEKDREEALTCAKRMRQFKLNTWLIHKRD